MKTAFAWIKKPWVLWTVGIVVAVLVLGALWSKFGGPIIDWFKTKFGNPSTDQSITGGDTFHVNQIDASLNSITGGTKSQVPADRTRLTEVQGLFKAAYGDRSWSDLTSDPGGFLAYMVTGDPSHLQN